MDYSLPGSSIHGIFQARVLEWDEKNFMKVEQYEQLSASDTFKANIYNKGPKTKRKINKQNRVKK